MRSFLVNRVGVIQTWNPAAEAIVPHLSNLTVRELHEHQSLRDSTAVVAIGRAELGESEWAVIDD